MYVVTIDCSLKDKLQTYLEEKNFIFSFPLYTFFQAKKKGISCTLYSSGKFVVSGKESSEFIEFFLEPEILQSFSYGYQNIEKNLQLRMGIDESGKGDFFGPLCIAGISTSSQKELDFLYSLNIKDSKLMKDSQIKLVAQKILQIPHHIITLFPEKYNDLYDKFLNLNSLLAWGHATVIEQLLTKTPFVNLVISDQFAKKEVLELALKKKNIRISLVQRYKAESDVVVAAASILARYSFISGINKLETSYKVKLPKGAGHLTKKTALAIYQTYGEKILSGLSKKHFKTFKEVIENK